MARSQSFATVTLDDDGLLGVIVGHGGDRIFLGSAPAGHEWTGLAIALAATLTALVFLPPSSTTAWTPGAFAA